MSADSKGLFDGAEVIFSYSRAQAIEDGVLVDVTETAREAGFKLPTAVTRAVWDDVVTPTEEGRKAGQSEAGRLWDVLWMLFVAIRKAKDNTDTIYYSLIVAEPDERKEVKLKAIIGPGDTPEPALTIMFPCED